MYTFRTRDNHDCEKAKGIYEHVADTELKYEDVLFIDHIWDMKYE